MPKQDAVALVHAALGRALQMAPQARAFERRLLEASAVRLCDLIDSIGLQDVSRLPALGWRRSAPGIWRHSSRFFPDILEREKLTIAIRVEQIELLLGTLNLETPIEGQAFSPFRRARLFSDGEVNVDGVERNGSDAHEAVYLPERRIRRALIHQQVLRTRRREFRSAEKGMSETRRLLRSAISDLGPNWACDLFLRAEREYWMRWCSAGQMQSNRQRREGVGWCNIDHHTYIASRAHVHDAIDMLIELGFDIGETLKVDGWASQLLEHPVLRTTVTVDFDLGPDESLERSPRPMPPMLWSGCAGLWVDLHGEGLLEGGLHHVACLLDRSAFARQARLEQVALLSPSSDRAEFFQQMTHADERAINPRRVDRLEHLELLTGRQAERFRLYGGLAAHFECVERCNGFSGYDTPATAPVALS